MTTISKTIALLAILALQTPALGASLKAPKSLSIEPDRELTVGERARVQLRQKQ